MNEDNTKLNDTVYSTQYSTQTLQTEGNKLITTKSNEKCKDVIAEFRIHHIHVERLSLLRADQNRTI